MSDYLLEVCNISKQFPGVMALDGVNLSVRSGIVHGIMGENGAGKSTLMKILQGIYQPSSGEICFKGKSIKLNSVQEALNLGISMIHQEMSPILAMTVAENIFLGREPVNKLGLVDHKALSLKTQTLLQELEINISPNEKMKDLSIANMQLIEIAKAISYNSDLIIMDEPTSAITIREVEQLFRIIAKLKERGVTILYITHKIDEVFRITDFLTVLRDGKWIGDLKTSEATQEQLISMMVGRELKDMFPKVEVALGDVALSVEGIGDNKRFQSISFNVRKGEILGVAGLMGSGRSEVMEAIFGLRPISQGKIFINGKEVNIRTPEDAIKNGIGFLTEDRKATGCIAPLSIYDNIAIANLDHYGKIFVSKQKMMADSLDMQQKLNIRTSSMYQLIKFLSGGNQQKVLIARWLLNNPSVFIVDEPTRGIDVNAKAEIYKLLGNLAKNGAAIILISSEMPEILGMSDRMIIMHEGRITGSLTREEATQERIMDYATQ